MRRTPGAIRRPASEDRMTTYDTSLAPGPEASIAAVPKPEIMPEASSVFDRVLVGVFVAVPFLALIAAVPLAWGWGLGWHDAVIAIAFYFIAGLGGSVGLHR